MNTSRIAVWLLTALGCLVVAGTGQADLIISNLPGDDGTSTFVNAQLGGSNGGSVWNSKAAGFTMPGGPNYRLENVQIRAEFFSDSFMNAAPQLTIYDDLGGTPNNPVYTLNTPAIVPGISTITFTAGAPFDLLAGATYWIVATNESAVANSYRWMASSPGVVPVGIASDAGYLFDTGAAPPTTPSGTFNSYAVNANVIPEPTGFVLFGVVLFGRLRRRP